MINKKEYLKMRNGNNLGDFLYYHYKKECEKKGYSILSSQSFLQFFNLWPSNHDSVKTLLRKYDIELGIVEIEDKNKKHVKFI